MTNDFNAVSGRRSGFPGFFLAVASIIFAGFVTVASMVGNAFYQSYKISHMPEETVQNLATQIVDPAVSAQKLEQQGFYKVQYGGMFLDDCRKKVLTDSFNDNLPTGVKADKISACIVEKVTEMSAASNNGYYRRRY